MKKIVVIVLGLFLIQCVFAQSDHILWDRSPAEHFEKNLPLGNGKMGAAVFEGVKSDKIFLNDATLWSGEPVNANLNPEVYKNLPEIRKALKNQDYKLVDSLNRKLQGRYSESYAPLGTMHIHDNNNFENYKNYQTAKSAKGDNYFLNLIFAGDYPDPSILRDGNDYYVVHSSFDYYPGLLIWHSKDLINWEPVTHALYKHVGQVWAPDLVKYNDKYYIYFPAWGPDITCSNYVVTANSIAGPWSDPVDLKIGNIDPGHFTDSNGKRYLYFSSGEYVSLSDDGLSVTGKPQLAYEGWKIPPDWSIECFCLEGPKVTKRGDYYYLTVAEGGTGGPPTSHMVISARSKSPFGPWENSPYNPIIRTTESSEKWWSKGHGTVFDDVKGKWWIIFHGYENGYYNKGRQTLLEPLEWTSDGWFKIPEGIHTDESILRPVGQTINTRFNLSDDFSGKNLGPQWQFIHEYDTSRFHLRNNSVILNSRGKSLAESNPLLCTPPDHSYTAQVEMVLEDGATGALVLYYNNKAYSGIAADKDNVYVLMRSHQIKTQEKPDNQHFFLKMKNINHIVDLYYSFDGIQWNKIENSVEVSSFNHNVLDGFLSLRIGLCAYGSGRVIIKNFTFSPIN